MKDGFTTKLVEIGQKIKKKNNYKNINYINLM